MIQTTKKQWRSLVLLAVGVVAVIGSTSAAFALHPTEFDPNQRAAPTKAIVEAVLKSYWDKSEASYPNIKVSLTLNDVKFGQSYVATLKEVEVEGFPRGGMVTAAIVDFTVRSYYTKETQAVRRVREARVYKDKFGEWAVSTGSVRGEDTTTIEPPGGTRAETPPKNPPATTKNENPPKGTPGEKDENGFVTPDFSEMEKYFQIVRTDYDFALGRFNMLVKATKKTNVFEWYLTFYDADGKKIKESSFNANLGTPPIGEPTDIYGYVPSEREMKQVTRIVVTRRPF